jgi:hypothetical protein
MFDRTLETIWSRCLVVLHLENRFPNLLLRKCLVEGCFQVISNYRGITKCEIVSGISILLWIENYPPDLYPRPFSFATAEDFFAQHFLDFRLAIYKLSFVSLLTPQALDELRDLQSHVAHISLNT